MKKKLYLKLYPLLFLVCGFTLIHGMEVDSQLQELPKGCFDWYGLPPEIQARVLWYADEFVDEEVSYDHKGVVNSVDFSQDGERVVSSGHNEVKICTVKGDLTGQYEHSCVKAVAFSGKRVASIGKDNEVKICTVTGKLIGQYEHPGVRVLVPGGKRVASGKGNEVKICTVTGKPIGQYEHPGVWALVLDDKRVASGDGAQVKICTVMGKPIGQYEHLRVADLSLYGNHVASGGSDKKVKICTVEGDLIGQYEHDDWIMAVDLSSSRVASGGYDNQVKVCTVDGDLIGQYGHDGWVKAVALSPGGKRVISGGYDNQVRIRDLRNLVVSQNRRKSFFMLEEFLLRRILYNGTLPAAISNREKCLFDAISDESAIKKFFAVKEAKPKTNAIKRFFASKKAKPETNDPVWQLCLR